MRPTPRSRNLSSPQQRDAFMQHLKVNIIHKNQVKGSPLPLVTAAFGCFVNVVHRENLNRELQRMVEK